MPAVLLSIAGNCLTVSTAIFTNAVYADKLLTMDLYLGTHGPENVLRVARIFTAQQKCAGALRLLYDTIPTLDKDKSQFGIMYPNPTADPPDATIPQFDFKLRQVGSRNRY